MAKREREVKQVGLIAQAQAEYEQLMDEIRGYCQQVRELREQAAVLQQSGRTDFQVREEIQKLLDRAQHLDLVAQVQLFSISKVPPFILQTPSILPRTEAAGIAYRKPVTKCVSIFPTNGKATPLPQAWSTWPPL
ncbi:hypothetical protein ACFCP7_28270, partial [Paenibacillus elgii]